MKKSILTALALLLAGCATTYHLPEADRSRAGWSIWDLKGRKLLVAIRPLEEGRVRVDANAETVSDDQDIDFGRSKRS